MTLTPAHRRPGTSAARGLLALASPRLARSPAHCSTPAAPPLVEREWPDASVRLWIWISPDDLAVDAQLGAAHGAPPPGYVEVAPSEGKHRSSAYPMTI